MTSSKMNRVSKIHKLQSETILNSLKIKRL
jgi:hypothetical protein